MVAKLTMNTLYIKLTNPRRKVETYLLKMEMRKNMGKVVLDVSYPIETDFSWKKIYTVPNQV